MNKTRWIIFAGVCVVLFGILFITSPRAESAFNGDAAKVITEGPIQDRVYGSADQKVVLIEYGDFQCPGCAGIAPTVTAIREEFKDKLTFVFRHYPLTDAHPNALAASTAAEAAGQQGKFYEMYEKLYQVQSSWSKADPKQRDQLFEQYAALLGLNIDQYKKDLTSKDISDKINRDRSTARKSFGIDGTPTFILNGRKLDSQAVFDTNSFKQTIKDELTKAGYKLE